MTNYSANLGSLDLVEKKVTAGGHPVMLRSWPLRPDAGELAAGLLVARDKTGQVHAYGEDLAETVGSGDGAAKDFSGTLGPVEPGIAVTDGVEAFTDDGFGTLTGSAGGTGKVDYPSGRFKVHFNAAPVNAAAIVATATHVPAGVLTRDAAAAADAVGLVCVSGPVMRAALLVGDAPADADSLAQLERMGVWPL